jgi:hypothetical protein
MTRIRFTKYGACTAFGEFGPGTIGQFPPALARHLVEELKVAEYIQAPAPEPIAEPVVRKGRRK